MVSLSQLGLGLAVRPLLGVAGTLARVLGGFAWFVPSVLLGAIHRAGHTASGLPRSFISAPVTPRGTGAPCTHVSHRIPFSNPIVFDSGRTTQYMHSCYHRFLSLVCLGPSSYRGHRAIRTIAVPIVTSAVTHGQLSAKAQHQSSAGIPGTWPGAGRRSGQDFPRPLR